MVTHPAVHRTSATVGEVRAFLADEHMHMALLVSGGELVGTIERSDLHVELDERAPAREVARLEGRTIGPEAELSAALEAMNRDRRRRLAVTSDDSRLLGLLCLKANGSGFCSDADVASGGQDR